MSSFQIPEGPSQVAPGGTAVFSVNNVTGDSMRGRLSVQVNDGATDSWFTLDGERERLFPAQESQTVSVRVMVPPGALPGDYRFHLRVVAVNDPDNDSAESPLVSTTVTATPAPVKKSFPIWAIILIAVLVLAAAGFGVWKLVSSGGDEPKPAPTATAAEQSQWFAGTWTGTIDGRPATMRWRVTGSGKGRQIVGEFSDGSSGSYVPLNYDSHTPDELFFRHADGNSWYLARKQDGQASGYTTWNGQKYPLVMIRRSLNIE